MAMCGQPKHGTQNVTTGRIQTGMQPPASQGGFAFYRQRAPRLIGRQPPPGADLNSEEHERKNGRSFQKSPI